MAEVLVEHESPQWQAGAFALARGLEAPWSGRCLLPPGLLPEAGRPWFEAAARAARLAMISSSESWYSPGSNPAKRSSASS